MSAIAIQPILDALTQEAQNILGGALHVPLTSYAPGAGGGNFPYYWQDSNNPLLMNYKTYNWIRQNLTTDPYSVSLANGIFANAYADVMRNIQYSLSTADKNAIAAAQTNASAQQAALLSAWDNIYGSYPTGPNPAPIDNIISTICTTWATPPISPSALANSTNLNATLNNIPFSGAILIGPLGNYVTAMGSALVLAEGQNAANNFLKELQANLGAPSAANGGIPLDNGSSVPGYNIFPQAGQIYNALNGTSSFTISLSVTRSSSTEYTVSVNGGGGVRIGILELFSLNLGGSADYFSDSLCTTGNTVTVEMTYTGVTLVNFGPAPFDQSSGKGWYWINPITDALKNGKQNVTGYTFVSPPTTDFSSTGPISFLSGVVISQYPTATITVTSSNYKSLANTLKTTTATGFSFLGINFVTGSSSSLQTSTSVDAANTKLTFTIAPPSSSVTVGLNDQLGWVLGVQTDYPAA